MGTRTEIVALAHAGEHAQAVWTKAAKKGFGHALLVAKNNPHLPIADVLNRPDVQEAIAHATVHASIQAQDAITKAWIDNGGPSDSPFLANLVTDSQDNAQAFGSAATNALLGGDPKSLKGLVSKYGFRQACGAAVAERRAKNEADLADYDGEIRWRATGPNPCPVCLALDGTVVQAGQPFDANLGPKPMSVYGVLLCPPRHPFCNCEIEDA